MSLNKLMRYFILPIYNPISGIHALLSENRRLLYSVLIFLFLGVIYTISVQLAYMKGIGAVTEPFIKIPADDYYYWQRFYQIPFFFLTSIVFAGVIRLLSEAVGGKGSFVDIFCIISITQTFPMFITMWIPETTVFLFFPGYEFNPIFDIARQVIGIIWPLVLAIIGITISEKIKWYFSILFTLIAAIPMTALMVIFIR